MDKTERDDDLQAFFDAARQHPAPASDALMSRVLSDALAVQATADTAVARAPRGGLLAGLWAAIGGWPAAAGLATATVAGLWIGFSPSLGLGDAMISGLGPSGTESYLENLATGFDYAFEEGETG